VVVQQTEVLRLDVHVLKIVRLIHQVEDFRRLLHVAEEFHAGDARQILLAIRVKADQQVLVRQFGDDDHVSLYQVHALQGEEKRMAHPLHARQRAQLLFGTRGRGT